MLFTAAIAWSVLTAMGQGTYIVKTKNVTPEKAEVTGAADETAQEGHADEAQDFVTKNFRYRSMCDWQAGMRFMVTLQTKKKFPTARYATKSWSIKTTL